MHTITRYHDISCGHRVVGHEGKCRYLHGHNYRIHFTCTQDVRNPTDTGKLDWLGRVIDFIEIKKRLCFWLEDNWDHKFLMWEKDPWLRSVNPAGPFCQREITEMGVVLVPFNPTAENIAQHLVDVIGPKQLEGTGIILQRVVVEETRKCSATYEVK